MSSMDSRKRNPSREEVCNAAWQVQNHIQCCIVLYMTKKDTIDTLFIRERINPSLTDYVWQRLEAENPEFFREYHLRLKLIAQINEFNRLLPQQKEFMMKHANCEQPPYAGINGGIICKAPSNNFSYWEGRSNN